MSTIDAKLFSSVKYFSAGCRDPSLETTLKQHGATRSFYLTETTTHVICDDFDSNKSELEQAIELYQMPIVTSEWILSCLKCQTLLPIDPFRSVGCENAAHLFRSCRFANANVFDNDHSRIYALVTYYGGQWSSTIDAQHCTHIICASALSNQPFDDDNSENHRRLCDAYELQSDTIHLITPDWIVDCLNENRRLNEAEYHPDLLKDPNEPMDIDDDELDDEINDDATATTTTTTNHRQSIDEHTPTKTTSGTHRTQLITKNFFNQSDQTTPPPSAEPLAVSNDGTHASDFMVELLPIVG
jgi:hypothetical protein